MMLLKVEDLLALRPLTTQNIVGVRRQRIHGISTDSRTTRRGDIFFAIKGEKFDGHEFLRKVFDAGALCAVVDREEVRDEFKSCSMIVVEDTTKALGKLAAIYRRKFDIPFIAVAGSNGKTSTKDMIARVLSKKYRVLKTKGNLNNHIGVPQTLFKLQQKHEIAVVEIGTNHFGELSYLCGILQPTHGIITNLGREHLEFFDNLRGVARAEGELFDALGTDGVGFVNLDSRGLAVKANHLRKKITFGISTKNARVRGTVQNFDARARAILAVKPRNKSSFIVKLSAPGKHVSENALAAATVGLSFGISQKQITQALETFRPSDKRMEVLRVRGVTIINDTYNANPDSMISALETLRAMKSSGKKIAILADMLELGARSEQEHRTLGKSMSGFNVDYLLTYGVQTKYLHEKAKLPIKFHYDQKNILSEYATELAGRGDIILVKGSRGMKMEDVVTFICLRLTSPQRQRV